jgi:hypothetical protein
VNPSAGGRKLKFPFAELNMCHPEHVACVKSQRDPELWHVSAIALLVYLGDPRGYLVWRRNLDWAFCLAYDTG